MIVIGLSALYLGQSAFRSFSLSSLEVWRMLSKDCGLCEQLHGISTGLWQDVKFELLIVYKLPNIVIPSSKL